MPDDPADWEHEDLETLMNGLEEVKEDTEDIFDDYDEDDPYSNKLDTTFRLLDNIEATARAANLGAGYLHEVLADAGENAEELNDSLQQLRRGLERREELDHEAMDEINSALRDVYSIVEDYEGGDSGRGQAALGRRKFLAYGGGAVLAALGAADGFNVAGTDSNCGGGLRYSEPGPDLDIGGLYGPQKPCPIPSEDEQVINEVVNEGEFRGVYETLDERQRRELQITGDYDALFDGEGREFVEANVRYRPGGDPTDSYISYTIELDGKPVDTDWIQVNDSLASKFAGGNA